MGRINGQSFDIRIGGFMVHVENFSMTIEDNSTTKITKGVPDGVLEGDKSASGEIEVDIANFGYISAAAKAAGSWEELPTFDINATAIGSNGNAPEAFHALAHDCKLKISELLSIDPNSSDATTVKLPFDVTGRDFIWINGTPYVKGTHFNLF